jgi:hypothetical protein
LLLFAKLLFGAAKVAPAALWGQDEQPDFRAGGRFKKFGLLVGRARLRAKMNFSLQPGILPHFLAETLHQGRFPLRKRSFSGVTQRKFPLAVRKPWA